jgi:hypothetical protein
MEHEQQTSTTTTTVRTTVPFITGEARTDLLEGELVYDAADPYAITMHLEARSGRVTWAFARELLAEGLYDPVGDGDVQVWPCLSGAGEAVVIIELCSPTGQAMLQTETRAVQAFVAASYDLVPAGQESIHLPMDALVAQLLSA